jgi:hypothetical protein
MTRREPIAELEDLRDDTMGIALETRMSFKEIHAQGGPTPQTISKWLYRETRFPQLATVRAILRPCGFDLSVIRQGELEPRRFSHPNITYPKPVKSKKRAPRSSR